MDRDKYIKEYRRRPEVKEKRRIYKNAYYKKNKIFLTKQTREHGEKYRNRYLFHQAKRRSRENGLEFNLDLNDIVVPELCPLLNIKLTSILGKGQLQTNGSLDRIDPSKGYVKGNVWVISRKANTMKSNATKEELITFANNILASFVR